MNLCFREVKYELRRETVSIPSNLLAQDDWLDLVEGGQVPI